MPRIRLFPVILFVLVSAFFVRAGHLVETLSDDDKVVSITVPAFAEEKTEEETSVETVLSEGEESETSATTNNEPMGDPFAPEFSEAELEILQSLSARREQIEKRERALEEKEKLLEVAQQRIDDKITEMNGLRAEIEQLLGKQQEVEEARFTKLVKIYENMKPKDAANIFNELQFSVLLSVVDRMSERKTAPILAAMDPIRARYLSAKLAEQKALPKP